MDIKKIKSGVDIVEVVEKYVTLKPRGAENVGLCPFHDDSKASLNVNKKKQVFFCGACGATGDVFDFLIKYGRTLKEAADELQGISSAAAIAGKPVQNVAKVSGRVEWKQFIPAPLPGQITHYKYGRPARIWEYKTADNKLIGYVCRFETREGKQIIPYVYCQDPNGRKEWRWQGFEPLRAVYGLADLAVRQKETVLIVEGEKAADAAQTLLPHVVVICWQGGSEAVRKTDWSVLAGRRVVVWPDNDKEQRYGKSHPQADKVKPWAEQPGNSAMLEICEILQPICPVLKWVSNVETLPNKWDIADAKEWTPDEAALYVRANIMPVPDAQYAPDWWADHVAKLENPEPIEPEKTPDPEPVQAEQEPPVTKKAAAEYELYFKFLGYEKDGDNELVVFFIKEAKMVHKYRSGSVSGISTLCTLAPLDFWQHLFPKKSGDKVDTVAALNWIIRASRHVGVFSSDKLRGRGAWVDEGRVIVHAGEKLVVNGQPVPLGKLETKFIYEAGSDLSFGTGRPLDNKSAHRLLEICQLINWERPISAHLLAGWCVVAPICGALPWRPHIWLTGSAGSGKSWALHKIIRLVLGRVGVMVQGETSEAGIRQTLGVDALPVVFDEAEGEDRRAADRVQSVLGLMRAASAEDGGFIAKGSANGGVKNYRIRACFAFASIAVSLKQQSDRSRVTILTITRNRNEEERNEKWKALQKLHTETITEFWCDSLQARTLALLPVILDNTKTFAAAAAAHLKDQRAGDQLGPLLAGAFSLSSNQRVAYSAALEWVQAREWMEERALDESRDENRLLAFLLDYITRVDGNGLTVERTIGELVAIAHGSQVDVNISLDSASARLKRLGMKADANFFYVSNTSAQIGKILFNTPWSVNHNRILERLPGAMRTAPERFAGHVGSSRTVAIPINLIVK